MSKLSTLFLFLFVLVIFAFILVAPTFLAESDSTAFADMGYSGHFIHVDTYNDLLALGNTYQGAPIIAGTVAYVARNASVSSLNIPLNTYVYGLEPVDPAPVFAKTCYLTASSSATAVTRYCFAYSTVSSLTTEQRKFLIFSDGSYLYYSGVYVYFSHSVSASPRLICDTIRFYDAFENTYYVIASCDVLTGAVTLNTSDIAFSKIFSNRSSSFFGHDIADYNSVSFFTEDYTGYMMYNGSYWSRSSFDPSTLTNLDYDRGYYAGLADALDSIDISDLLLTEDNLQSFRDSMVLNLEDCPVTYDINNHIVCDDNGSALLNVFTSNDIGFPSDMDPSHYTQYTNVFYQQLGRSFVVNYSGDASVNTSPIPFELVSYRLVCEVNGDVHTFEFLHYYDQNIIFVCSTCHAFASLSLGTLYNNNNNTFEPSEGDSCLLFTSNEVFGFSDYTSFTLYELSCTTYAVTDLANIPWSTSFSNYYSIFDIPALSSLSTYFYNLGVEYERSVLADDHNAVYTLKNIVFALVDAPFYSIKNALNFEIFGINLSGFILSVASVAFVFFLIKKIKGGF